jgi:hypothetical protein
MLGPQRFNACGDQRHGPLSCTRLRLVERPRRTADFDHLLSYVNHGHATVQVDVAPSQAERFADPQTGDEHRRKEVLKVFPPCRFSEPCRVVRRENIRLLRLV